MYEFKTRTELIRIVEEFKSERDAAKRDAARAFDERNILLAVLQSPEIVDFMKGVPLEAAHQRERWGTEHDEGKSPPDWFWLLGYLGGKALRSHLDGDTDKALHHTITVAAVAANWHAAILGKTNMRPGIASPDGMEP